MFIVPLSRKKITNIAKPIDDSAAATVSINITNICPIRSSKYDDPIRSIKLTESNINSTDIMTRMTFFLLRKIPVIPIKNIINETTIKTIKSIAIF